MFLSKCISFSFYLSDFLMIHTFYVLYKKSLPKPMSQIFSSVFSLSSFIVLYFTFRTMMYFKLGSL